MTNKEALAAKLLVPVSDSTLLVALIDRSVDPETEYAIAQQEPVERALMDCLFAIFTNPDITEGGYSLSHPDFQRKIKERLLQLAAKYNDEAILSQLVPAGPTITSRPVW